MATNPKFVDDIEELKTDASKVLTDISKLSRSIPEAGKASAVGLSQDAMKTVEASIAEIQGRLTELSDQLGKQVKKADKNVHENPYLYMAGAVGVGFLLGKLLFPRTRE